jgi:alpha-glucosidase
VPFFYDLLHRYHADYEPMVRPTWLDFPNDPQAWAECDEHLLGPDLLVACVMEEGATERTVRPPVGADWIDVWSGVRLEGGVPHVLSAPVDGNPPLLARAGSAMLVDLATGGWRPGEPDRGIWLFPPAEGAFDWSAIEDSGDDAAPVDRWQVRGNADATQIRIEITRVGPGTGDPRVTLLLPPGDARDIIVGGGASVPVERDSRRGVTLTI